MQFFPSLSQSPTIFYPKNMQNSNRDCGEYIYLRWSPLLTPRVDLTSPRSQKVICRKVTNLRASQRHPQDGRRRKRRQPEAGAGSQGLGIVRKSRLRLSSLDNFLFQRTFQKWTRGKAHGGPSLASVKRTPAIPPQNKRDCPPGHSPANKMTL